MKRGTTVLILASLYLLLGCAGPGGKTCISVGGEYKGVDGNLQYCWDAGKTKENGVPTFDGPKGKSFLLDEGQVKKIADLVRSPKVEAKTAKKSGVAARSTPRRTPIQFLLYSIRR